MDDLEDHRLKSLGITHEKIRTELAQQKPPPSIKSGADSDEAPDESYEITGYCPKCLSINLKPQHHGYQGKTWRWRECLDCDHKFKQRRVEILSEEACEELEAEGKEVRALEFFIQRM